ncbi:MAG: transglycosylase SLT domain-containing protein [Ardenticatenales bacterium]|nr:transglycosylase SLT domain-containing protein [Ardenticatenales bacterium]
MAAATPTFDSIPTLEVRVPTRPALLRGRRPSVVVAIVFGALGAAAFVGSLRGTQSAARSSGVVAPVFMSFAAGDVRDRVAVRTEPGGGETVALLPAGTRVGIGGRAAFGDAWASGVDYWVAAEIDGHVVRGFVPAGGVDVQAGDPPVLSFEGADAGGGVSAAASVVPIESVGAGRDAADTADTAAADVPVRASAAPTVADTVAIPWLPEPVRSWSELLSAAAVTHGVAADLLAIVTLVESGGHPSARSHAGATGLMQVMPATAGDIARQRGLGAFDASRLNEPAVAIDFGAWYLAQQLKAFGQADDADWAKSVTLAAAAYNGGPGTAMRFQRDGSLPNETRHYIDWVGGMWRERADVTSSTYERWMAAGGSVLVGKAQAWLDAGGGP